MFVFKLLFNQVRLLFLCEFYCIEFSSVVDMAAILYIWNEGGAVSSQRSVFTGNQMGLGGATLGVTTSEQTNLHTDSLPNTLNTNKSVSNNKYIAFVLLQES